MERIELPVAEEFTRVQSRDYSKFLLSSSIYKHLSHQRITSFQRDLLRLCRGHSLDELPYIAREALFWEQDCDASKGIHYMLDGEQIVAVNSEQAEALRLFGNGVDEVSTSPILRDFGTKKDLIFDVL